jgi:hypothetical protein
MLIPPRASANVLGRANAMASAIVVSFMVGSFVVQIGDNRTGTIKFFFSAIEAAKLFTSCRALMAIVFRRGPFEFSERWYDYLSHFLSLGHKHERYEHSSR